MNNRSNTSIPPYAIMACTRTTLPLLTSHANDSTVHCKSFFRSSSAGLSYSSTKQVMPRWAPVHWRHTSPATWTSDVTGLSGSTPAAASVQQNSITSLTVHHYGIKASFVQTATEVIGASSRSWETLCNNSLTWSTQAVQHTEILADF